MDKIWQVKNSSGGKTGELMIMGDIENMSWYEEDVTPQKILSELESLGKIDELKVLLNSNGGSVFAGVTISNVINQYAKDNDVEVTGYVMGLAASIASIIACSLPKLVMYPSSMLMIHNPLSIMRGDANDFRKMADDLDSIRESLIITYKNKTNLSREEIIDLLDDESWLTSEQCIEYGFADETESSDIAASISEKKLVMNGVKFDISKYQNVPKHLFNVQNKTKTKGDESMFKNFETKEDFNTAVSDINKTYKAELLENEDFLNETRKGYISVEEVLNKFTDLDLEGNDLDAIVNSVKSVKETLDTTKIEYEDYQNGILFENRKVQLANYGYEVSDEEKEDIVNMSEKAFSRWTNSLEIASAGNKKDDNDNDNDDNFDPNAIVTDNNNDDDNDNDIDVANSLFV